MHKFLRAIGFSEVTDKKELQRIIVNTIRQSTEKEYTIKNGQTGEAQFNKEFVPGAGLAVCGTYDEEQRFTYEYYFPYVLGSSVSSTEPISVDRHAAQESYAGMCDDTRVGVSLIFFLQNHISYMEALEKYGKRLPGAELTLTALSLRGTILLPIAKTKKQREKARRRSVERSQLVAAARQGDERAIESLTLEEMDLYTAVSRRVYKNKDDIFTVVDNYFAPHGLECDQYAILGEILEWRREVNFLTQETVYIMKIDCNSLLIDVAINAKDLFGQPWIGCRFKGNVWMQGAVRIPEK